MNQTLERVEGASRTSRSWSSKAKRRHATLAPKLNIMPGHLPRLHVTAGLAAAIAASLVLLVPAGPAEAGCSKRVYVYSAEWCGTCRRLRNYLDLSGITYTLLDADNPRVKADMRARFRSVAVPHMLVGRHVIRGLNTEKIRRYCR